MSLKEYVSIARPAHWFKNAFMLPGILIAVSLSNTPITNFLMNVALSLVSACLLSSANYVINEWLDSKCDSYHSIKKQRPIAQDKLKIKFVFLEYILLVILGLAIAWKISHNFLLMSIIFLIMGIVYNVKPLRLKEVVYIDVLSESINNPIRLYLGWFSVINNPLPPSSLVLGYWMGGAFLMTIKRFAEYRSFDNQKTATLYRKSFKDYTEDRLLISAFFYGLTAAFFIGVFLVKYRIELLLSLPCFALLFTWYLSLGFKKDSIAQNPEKLFRQKSFILYVIFLLLLVIFLLKFKLPLLSWFLKNAFLSAQSS